MYDNLFLNGMEVEKKAICKSNEKFVRDETEKQSLYWFTVRPSKQMTQRETK